MKCWQTARRAGWGENEPLDVGLGTTLKAERRTLKPKARRLSAPFARAWGRWLAFVLLLTGSVRAQEAVRLSLASAEAAEARRRAAATLGYYNLKLGPTAWRLGASLGTEWSDNIRLEGQNPKSDFLFRPEMTARMLWPISDKNSINLSLGAGYTAYASYSEYNRFYVRPGSELSFDFYVGDFWINVHDRFSILEDSYLDPTVVGSADYSRLENAAGVTALWDLNKILLRAGYDHLNYLSLRDDTGSQPDGRSDMTSLSAGYAPAAGLLFGVEVGGGLIHYEAGPRQGFEDASQWNAGVFTDTQISEYIRLRGSVGYVVFSPEPLPAAPDLDEFSGLYCQLALIHRLNEYVTYTLSGGRNVSFTFYGGTIDLYQARLAANWRLLHKISLNTSLDYEHGEYLTFGSEKFDRVGPAFTLGRGITEKLSASLGYRLYWRNSNVPNRDYTVNVVSLRLVYAF